MPRSIWKGAVSFGLVTIPVRVYGATEEKDISFNQVHAADGGRIRQKRVCEKCGEEIPYDQIAKGYTAPDGRQAILEKSDFDDLPLTSSKAVDVVQFVDAAEVDPTYFNKTYVLEAEGPGAKPYVLLRDALRATGKSAVVKVALRSREQLALIRPVGEVLHLHTMLWPDEIRDASFAAPSDDIKAAPAEVKMAEMFIESMAAPFNPDEFTDAYREALDELVNAKLSGTAVAEATDAEAPSTGGDVVDLVAALRASVEAAKAKRAEAARAAAAEDDAGAEAEASPKPARKTAAKTAKAADKPAKAAAKAPAKARKAS